MREKERDYYEIQLYYTRHQSCACGGVLVLNAEQNMPTF